MRPASTSVSEARVAVITTQGCRFCKVAKGRLAEEGIPYAEVDVSHGDTGFRALVAEETGSKTVPQASITVD